MEKELIRKINEVGAIVIPNQWFKMLKFQKIQAVKMTIEYGKVCIKKYEHKDISKIPYVGIVRYLTTNNKCTIPMEYVELCGLEKGKVQLVLNGNKIEISKIDKSF